jgi:hypothetical protein
MGRLQNTFNLGRVRRIDGGQFKGDNQAAFGRVGRRHSTAVKLERTFGDRKTQTGPIVFRPRAIRDSVKGAKNSPEFLGWHTRTVIAHLNNRAGCRGRFQTFQRESSWSCVLYLSQYANVRAIAISTLVRCFLEGTPVMKSLAQTPLSVLDLAPIREGKSLADTFAASLTLARRVDSLGYKRFWLAEHHNLAGVASSATSVLIGYIAAGTTNIRVGSGGIMLPNHAPLMVAEEFGTLETLYPGRIDLGLGRAPGTDQATMRALRGHLGPEVDFAEQLQQLQYFFAPIKPGQRLRAIPGANLQIPIWILGSSLYSAHLAAAHGLPYAFAGHFAPEEMLDAIAVYRQ